MMSYDEHNLLESVINITEERNKRSLINVLVEVLSDLIDFDALIILRVPRDNSDEYLEVAASMPVDAYQDKLKQIPYQHEHEYQYVQIDDSTSVCIDSREIFLETESDINRILFPIVVNNIVTGILDIYGHHHTEHTETLISSFIRIYSNFLAVIDDNEHDTLTGLLNRKTFDTQLSDLLSDTDKNIFPITIKERRSKVAEAHRWIGILDIDHFKVINDNFGHIYGDEVLLLFANLMRKSFRCNDLLFRYGGEEFVVVLAPTKESDALLVFERFRQKLETSNFPRVERVTVSIGMVKIDKQKHAYTLLEHADKSLYYAKEHGRNQVCNYHELRNAGLLEERKIKSSIELF